MNHNFTERRVTNQVCDYWRLIKQGRKYPKKDDIDFEEIVQMLPYCVIIDIIADKDSIKYEYSHTGEMVKQFHKEGVFVETFIPFVSPEIETFQEYLEEICDNGSPIIEESEATNINQETVKFRQCMLPLSSDGEKVTGVLCAISCKPSRD